MTNIFVGNLSFRTTQEEIHQIFANYGAVERVNLVTDRDSGQSRGFAFVEMTNSNEAEAAINALNGTELHGRNINVNVARPKPAGGGGWGAPQRQVTVAGLVLEVKKRNNRTLLTLDDGTGRLEVSLFDDMAQNHKDLVVKDALVIVEGGLKWDDFSEGWRLSAKKLTGLETAREQQARRLILRWPRRLAELSVRPPCTAQAMPANARYRRRAGQFVLDGALQVALALAQ